MHAHDAWTPNLGIRPLAMHERVDIAQKYRLKLEHAHVMRIMDDIFLQESTSKTDRDDKMHTHALL